MIEPPMPETLETIQKSSSVPPSAFLQARIAALRRKHVWTAALTGLAMAVGVGIELLALAMFVDWWMDLPWIVRLLLLLAQMALFAFIVVRFTLIPLIKQPDDDELALMVEKARPEFRSRLIAAIQLTRPGAISPGISPVLVDAMVEETEAMAAPLEFARIVSTDKLKKLGALAISVLILGSLGMLYGRSTTWDLLRRSFLSKVAVPRKTHVTVLDGNKIIGRGDNVRLEAFVDKGIIPSHGKVEVQYRGRRVQEFSLEQNRDNRIHFGRTIENVQDSFTYVIFLNDGRSEPYEVKTISRPTVSAIECEQQYPAYTKLKPAHRSPGDLSLLAGSLLKLKVIATKDMTRAAIALVGMENEFPMQVNPQNPRELTGEFTVPTKGITGFLIHMLDTEGMESRDSAVYRVDVIPDKAPVVRLTYPDRKEDLITRQATFLVGMEVADDFEIAKLRLRYKVSTVEEGAGQTVELDLEGENPQRLRRRHEWKIGAFNPLLSEGSVIEYWIEAVDNNNATGPGVGVSEHQFARVVSESEKRADLLNRAGDYLGSISDVAADQDKLNRNLGAIIREKVSLR
jgi:hypothetical protein